jgi:hypothetical protein
MNEAKQKFLVLTCDTEAVPPAAPAEHVDRLIWGRLPEAPYEAGIGKMMDIAEEFGARMVFFHDVLEQHSYGEPIAEAARYVVGRGHDLQLHMHPEFLPSEFWARHDSRPPTWSMNLYDSPTASRVMEHGLELFERMVGFRPVAYRAGAFRYNARTLEMLDRCRIPLSFQYYPASALKPSFPHGFDAGILPVFKWSNGVIEVPLGMQEFPHPRPHGFRYRAFDLNQFSGGAEQAHQTLRQFWQNGPEFTVCVMLLHSWSFLEKNGSGYFHWKGDSRVKFFRDFLQAMPPDVQIITATELLRKIGQQEVEPAFELPIQVAGTDGIPMLSLSQSKATTTGAASSNPIAMTAIEPPPPREQPTIPDKKLSDTIRAHDEEMREWRRHLVESFPYPRLEDAHVRGAQLLASRYQMLERLPNGGTVCEIGVANGDFSACILDLCKPARLHLVDMWDSERYSADREKVFKRFAEQIAAGQVTIHVGASTQKLPEFPDRTFDWVYVDTVHDYAVTARELELCRTKVKPGGIIAGHDYTAGNIVTPVCYGVVQAVQEFCVKNRWRYLFLTCESHCYWSFAIQAMDIQAA